MPQHNTKHWIIQVGGLGQWLAFESANLHMGNREAYTLSAGNLVVANAAGEATSATPVSVAVPQSIIGNSCRVFRVLPDGTKTAFWTGTVTRFRMIRSGGRVVGNTLTAAGGWHFLERLVYTQPAKFYFGEETEASERQTSRIVLGQSPTGSQIGVDQQLRNLAAFSTDHAGAGATPNAFSVSLPVGFSTFHLPHDEMRDATISQCLDRLLRYVPGVVIAQRNGLERRFIDIFTAAAVGYSKDAAGYMEGGKILEIDDGGDDSAIAGVRVEIEKVGSANGKAVRRMQVQLAPEGGTPGPGWMYVTLQLSGREASRSIQRLDMQTEDFPASLNDAAWWTARLGDAALKNVVGLAISDGARSGAGNHPEWYPRIALKASPEAIEEAGLKSRIEKITCKASYTLNDEAGNLQKIVEEKPLEIEVITTSATTRQYTWTSAASVTGADPTPVGLAAALLAQHAQDGRSITALIRLPISGENDYYFNDIQSTHEGLPGPGDTYDGLVCQTADYDLAAHTVRVAFGPPSHVSPQDLASLMVGGRTRTSCSISAATLISGEVDGDKIDTTILAAGGGKAVGDGKVTRLVIPKTGSGTQSKIDIDPSKIGGESPLTIQPREITYLVADGGGGLQAKKAWIMASAEEEEGSQIPLGGIPEGTEIVVDVIWDTTSATPEFMQLKAKWDGTAFVNNPAATQITALTTHEAAHGVT